MPRILPLVGTSSFSNSMSTVRLPSCLGFSGSETSNTNRPVVDVAYIVVPMMRAPTPSPIGLNEPRCVTFSLVTESPPGVTWAPAGAARARAASAATARVRGVRAMSSAPTHAARGTGALERERAARRRPVHSYPCRTCLALELVRRQRDPRRRRTRPVGGDDDLDRLAALGLGGRQPGAERAVRLAL